MISRNKNQLKKQQTETRNNFYLSFFDIKEEYKEININGYWLIKSFNTETKQNQCALYSEKSYLQYKGLEH